MDNKTRDKIKIEASAALDRLVTRLRVADKRAEELQRQLDMSRKANRTTKDIAIKHMLGEKELRAQVEILRNELKNSTNWIQDFDCKCSDGEMYAAKCTRCCLVDENKKALSATDPKQENKENA